MLKQCFRKKNIVQFYINYNYILYVDMPPPPSSSYHTTNESSHKEKVKIRPSELKNICSQNTQLSDTSSSFYRLRYCENFSVYSNVVSVTK